MTDAEAEKIFENEVRRVARELWPTAEFGGAEMIDGRERDAIFETEDCVHSIECTVSRSRQKAEDDSKKLYLLNRRLQSLYPQKAVKAWFITKDEPTAEQRSAIKDKYPTITPLGFSQFQSKLVDAALYLNLRDNYHFGSVRDPATGGFGKDVEYIELDLIERSTEKLCTVRDVYSGLLSGNKYLLLGDYGAGKSMTLRQVFREARLAFFRQKTSRFPIYINLRDHFGQTEPAEVLERHARIIGFPNPSHLVRAWRSGYVVLVVDGFDELTTLGIQGLWKKLQEVRYRAMEVVRRFLREQPANVGIILAGREHFFDSEKERKAALFVANQICELTLNEFSDEQIKRYFLKSGLDATIPNWIPSRPLLVGYLAASGVLARVLSHHDLEAASPWDTPAKGWDLILDQVCLREAEIEAGIDGPTVRRILDRIATIARQGQSGLGPISQDSISRAFFEICGYHPDEKGAVLLQRLPGLGIDRADEGTRTFLDEDFADVCRAGDVLQYLGDPFGFTPNVFRGADHGLEALGLELVVAKIRMKGFSSGKLIPALRKALEIEEFSTLAADLVGVSIEFGCAIEIPVQLTGMHVTSLEFSKEVGDCSKLTFVSCLFSRLALDHDVAPEHLPRFRNCYVDELDGRSSVNDLPQGVFSEDCEFGHFSEATDTSAAIGSMDLPLGSRVLLTILKKIFLQSGSGRKENALYRGLDHHGKRLVEPILRLLQAEGMISMYRRSGLQMKIWVPERSCAARVQRLITSPRTCGDDIFRKVAELS